jgi:hypothetical protein
LTHLQRQQLPQQQQRLQHRMLVMTMQPLMQVAMVGAAQAAPRSAGDGALTL